MSRYALLVTLVLGLTAWSVHAAYGQADPYTLTAFPVEAGAILLDGVLNEPAWASAMPATDFVQFRPTSGAAASETTVGRVLIGPSTLYIGMRMEDPQPQHIDRRLARRDLAISSDHAAVVIDSYGDDRTAFLFRVSPGGVVMDILFYDDTEADRSWDAVWDVATQVDETGWTAEFAIPLSQLRYTAGEGPHRWGLQLARIHFRTSELSYWSPRSPTSEGYVSQFGTLLIPSALPAPRRFEAVPYMASAVTRAPGDPADPFFAAQTLEPRVGLDVRLGLTSGLTLTATVNPDFGQVEADPAQVNLGGFELFFEERRPFFVEGTDVFSMAPRRALNNRRPTLLYTRRIGRAPRRTSFVPSALDEMEEGGAVYTEAPVQSTILGAAKLSGRAGRFSLGLLNATTRPEYGRFEAFDHTGQRVSDGRAVVEPLSNYLVARARGTYGETLVGGLLTSVLHNTDDPVMAAMVPATATVAGLDLEHPLNAQWRLTAQALGSTVTGQEEAITALQTAFPRVLQRPDAAYLSLDTTRTALSGWAGEANVLKTEGRHWTGGVHLAATSPGFDANALGFQPRADFVNADARITFTQPDARGPFASWSASMLGGVGWTFGGQRVANIIVARARGELRNFWQVGVSTYVMPRSYDDRLTRGGPMARRAAEGSVELNVRSDVRKPVVMYAAGSVLSNELGQLGVRGSAGLDVRPSDALTFSLEPELDISDQPRQYVTAFEEPAATSTFGRRYVFGQLEATSVALEARLDWTFRPTLSLQLFARPFASRGRYTAFKAFDRPGALALPVYGKDLGTASLNADGSTTIDPGDDGAPFTVARDFTVRSLQGNAVLRWEFRPGSTLFLVWQHQRRGGENDGALRMHRDVLGLFGDPPTNVFLVKLSYWLG